MYKNIVWLVGKTLSLKPVKGSSGEHDAKHPR